MDQERNYEMYDENNNLSNFAKEVNAQIIQLLSLSKVHGIGMIRRISRESTRKGFPNKKIILPGGFVLQKEFVKLLSQYNGGIKHISNVDKDGGWERAIVTTQVPDFLFENPSLEKLQLCFVENDLAPRPLFNENFAATNLNTLWLKNVPISDINGLESLENCKNIKIENAPLSVLPEGLSVNDLVLINTNIQSIPDSTKIKNALRIKNTKDTSTKISIPNLRSLTQGSKGKGIFACELVGVDISRNGFDRVMENCELVTIQNCTVDREKVDDQDKEFDPMAWM